MFALFASFIFLRQNLKIFLVKLLVLTAIFLTNLLRLVGFKPDISGGVNILNKKNLMFLLLLGKNFYCCYFVLFIQKILNDIGLVLHDANRTVWRNSWNDRHSCRS